MTTLQFITMDTELEEIERIFRSVVWVGKAALVRKDRWTDAWITIRDTDRVYYNVVGIWVARMVDGVWRDFHVLSTLDFEDMKYEHQ